jgi:NitT/TauT family transport system permease protein
MTGAARARLVSPTIVIASLAVGALGWEIAGRLKVSTVFPPLSDVLSTAFVVAESQGFADAVSYSATTFLIAMPLSLAAGLIVGILMGTFRWVEWALDVWVNAFLSLPLLALIPVIILLFGIGREASVVVVFLSTFFPVAVNAAAGVRAITSQYEEMARSFGSGRLHRLMRITLPGSLPLMLTGIRIATGRAVRGVIYAEIVMGIVGVGGLLRGYGQAFRISETWALIIFLAIVGLASMEFVRVIEDRLLRAFPQGKTIDAQA